MTAIEDPRISYAVTDAILNSDGDHCSFPVPFAFERIDDISIILGDGQEITDFDVTFTDNTPLSGSVNVLKALLQNASTVYIYRDMAYARETEFQADSDFRAAVINGEFDRMIWQIQQMGMFVNGALHKPLYDNGPALELPDTENRKNKIMGFDASGVPIALDDNVTSANKAIDAASDASISQLAASQNAIAADAARSLAEAAVEKIGWSDVVFMTSTDSPVSITDISAGKMYSFDCSGGDIQVNLENIDSLTLVDSWSVGLTKRDSSGYQIMINPSGTDTIGDDTFLTIGTRNAGVTLVPDTDLDPNIWTPMRFGAVSGNMTINQFLPSVDYTPDVDTNLTLSIAPGEISNLMVTFDGVSQHRSTFSLSHKTLTFDEVIPASVNEIEIWIGSTVSIGVPADGTITAAKLAPGFSVGGPGKKFTNNGSGITLNLNGEGDAVLTHEMTGDTTLSASNIADIGKVYSFVVRLKQDSTGGHTLTPPNNTIWAYGETPVFPTNPQSICKFAIETWDNGTTWEASWIGADYA